MLYINIWFTGINIAPTSTVRNLGVMFDSEMSMKAHVNSINRSVYPQLKNLRAIKTFGIQRQQIQLHTHLLVSFRCRKLYCVWYLTLPTSMHTENTEHCSYDSNWYKKIWKCHPSSSSASLIAYGEIVLQSWDTLSNLIIGDYQSRPI